MGIDLKRKFTRKQKELIKFFEDWAGFDMLWVEDFENREMSFNTFWNKNREHMHGCHLDTEQIIEKKGYELLNA